jgi:hypothetical protein
MKINEINKMQNMHPRALGQYQSNVYFNEIPEGAMTEECNEKKKNK